MEFAEKTDQFKQIEGQSDSNCANFVSSKAASWPIVLGSLDDTVNCESSISPVDSDGNSASPKSVLVLRRPSHDCGPCEIKISFEQKHEIRQVYVRSTARVFEIYYAADRQSMNEYLCTVRCGMAAKTKECLANEYLQNMGAATSISPSSTGSNKLSEELKTESGGSTNEDGWVEIKDPNPSLTEDGDSSLSNKTEVRVERENQDFYEATAEISDANPCTSMTIRLLSLQSGESVYLDEIYVFADPLECDDVNSTSKEVECSAGNPLMSMLVPTLLQLSRSRMSNISEQPDPITKLKKSDLDVSRNISSASTSVKIQQEEIPSVSIEQGTVSSKLECPDQSTYHIGKTLDQIVSRIARIEEFCLRFEQRMINPITRMDARLGEVEKQLKLLNEKFQLPEMHSSTKAHTPDSDFSSFHTDGNTIPNSKVESLEVEKDDCLSYEVPAPSSDISSVPLENDDCCTVRAHLVPSLVITAPEFCYGEEEEDDDDDDDDDDDSKSVGGSPCDKLKKPLSIDDALADALAGFVSSTSMQDSTSTLDPDTSKIIASQHIESDELVVTIETSIDAATENREYDALLFSSNSEPTVELIAGHDNFFVPDAENEIVQAEKTIAEKSGEMVMKEDSLHGILELPINSVVDYKIPILDVKFASRELSNLSSSIEALLTETETAETDIGSSSALIEPGNHLLVDLGHDDSIYLSHNNSNEEVPLALF